MTQAAYRIDGALVPRERFYAVACDPKRHAVVQACAGAGKTWMLVSRMLRALLDGAEPHEILAITFTRKAAGEMRERLGEWLARYGDPATSDADRHEALVARGLDAAAADAAVPLLLGLQQRVLDSGRAVQIHTFHAWFAQLLRQAPLDLLASIGLQPGMQLIEATDDLHDDLFRRFHAHVLRDAGLHADYARLVQDRGRSRTRKWLLAALDKRIEIELADAAGTLEGSVPPLESPFAHPFDALQSEPWRDALRDLAIELGQGNMAQQEAATGLVMATGKRDSKAAFDEVWIALFTKQDQPRKLGTSEQLAVTQDHLVQLATLAAAHDAHLEHARMTRLARVLLAEYAALKRARALIDMADLERCALALLRDSQLAAWVQERLDARVRHVLIDEFQDTSPLQWQALLAWLSGYAGAGGGASGQRPPGVFIVGDPKQSIYRFRRAEPRVFDAAVNFVRDGLGGSALACDHTRRNSPAVLLAVNGVFGHAAAQGTYDGFRPHTTEVAAGEGEALFALPSVKRPPRRSARRSGAAIELLWRDSLTTARHEPDDVLRQHEAERVADAVVELIDQRGIAAGEIMVLSRKRASLRLLAGALQSRHVPYAAAEDTPLLEAPEVRDLLALLDVLVSTRHQLSLAHALRSPVFGASDDDLVQLALRAREGAGGHWWRALQTAKPGDRLSPAMQRAQALLARWRQAARRLPPHDLLDAVVAEGDVRLRVAAAVQPERRRAALAAIDALLGQSLALDGGRYASPYGFVRALRRRALTIAAPAHREAVQLLTVHGAKGLESRVVFVMDADPEMQPDETCSVLVDWPVNAPAPRVCAFIAAFARVPPGLAALARQEVIAEQREELNGLYVAMTRAQDKLVFSKTPPLRHPPGPSWWSRVEPLATPWSPTAAVAAAAVHDEVTLRALPRWIAPAAAIARSSPSDSESSRLGQALHRVLEWAGASSVPLDLEAASVQAVHEFGAGPAYAADVARHAAAILGSAACARFFDRAALRWSGNEVAVSVNGEVRRIDRLVQLADREWWVLDYKMNAAPHRDEANLHQLRGYRDAVAALQPGAVVRSAFVTAAGRLIEPDAPRGREPAEE